MAEQVRCCFTGSCFSFNQLQPSKSLRILFYLTNMAPASWSGWSCWWSLGSPPAMFAPSSYLHRCIQWPLHDAPVCHGAHRTQRQQWWHSSPNRWRIPWTRPKWPLYIYNLGALSVLRLGNWENNKKTPGTSRDVFVSQHNISLLGPALKGAFIFQSGQMNLAYIN